jgi:uncharacterized DUF497 family protein
MDLKLLLSSVTHFIWDEHNQNKNWRKHGVSWEECEQAIGDMQVVLARDPRHSKTEQRWDALGRTFDGRHLFIAFTIRKHGIRVISARSMNRKERRIYETIQKNS